MPALEMLARFSSAARRAMAAIAIVLAVALGTLHAANQAGWNPSDRYADITLSSVPNYLGTNVGFLNSVADGAYRSARSATGKSSGNWCFQIQNQLQIGNNFSEWGIGNASMLLSHAVDSDVNSYAVYDGGGLYHNGVQTYNPGSFSFNSVGLICANVTAGRLYARFRNVGGMPVRNDSGWIDWSGTAVDPTNSGQGTDISGLGAPLYAVASAKNSGSSYGGLGNFGGWPTLTDLIPLPAGYALWDANYPYTMPAGIYTLSHTSNVGVLISQNSMRATVDGGAGTDVYASSLVFPAGKKVIWAVFFDTIQELNTSGPAIINNVASANSSSMLWLANGTTQNGGGATWAGVRTGQVVYCAYDDVNQRAWIYAGGQWWGSGGGADPGSNVAGIDVSGIGSQATRGPGIYLLLTGGMAATFNAGRLTDGFTLPTGFVWLDPAPVQTNAMQRPRIIQ